MRRAGHYPIHPFVPVRQWLRTGTVWVPTIVGEVDLVTGRMNTGGSSGLAFLSQDEPVVGRSHQFAASVAALRAVGVGSWSHGQLRGAKPAVCIRHASRTSLNKRGRTLGYSLQNDPPLVAVSNEAATASVERRSMRGPVDRRIIHPPGLIKRLASQRHRQRCTLARPCR